MRSAAFRPLYRILFWLFVVDCLLLGWIGGNDVKFPYYEIGQFTTFWYFFYFLVLLPLCGRVEAYLWRR